VNITDKDLDYVFNKVTIFYKEINKRYGFEDGYDYGEFMKERCVMKLSSIFINRYDIYCSIFEDDEAFYFKICINVPKNILVFETNLGLDEYKDFYFNLDDLPFGNFQEAADYLLPNIFEMVTYICDNLNKRMKFKEDISDPANIRDYKLDSLIA
jgi:hypothetical protein